MCFQISGGTLGNFFGLDNLYENAFTFFNCFFKTTKIICEKKIEVKKYGGDLESTCEYESSTFN